MPRNRMIRPEFWEDRKISLLRYPARLLFIAMWNFADDEGYLNSDPEWLKIKCFPYDKINVLEFVDELINAERIDTKNGIIHIKNFLKYQKINRPYPSALKKQFSECSVNSLNHSSHKIEVKEKLKEIEIEKEVKEPKPKASEFIAGAKEPNDKASLFKRVWERYPRKDGSKEAYKHFSTTVNTVDDWQDIKNALEYYKFTLKRDKVEPKYIKMGSTWFNNWKDFIPPPDFIRQDNPQPVVNENIKKLEAMCNIKTV